MLKSVFGDFGVAVLKKNASRILFFIFSGRFECFGFPLGLGQALNFKVFGDFGVAVRKKNATKTLFFTFFSLRFKCFGFPLELGQAVVFNLSW